MLELAVRHVGDSLEDPTIKDVGRGVGQRPIQTGQLGVIGPARNSFRRAFAQRRLDVLTSAFRP
jgi:hypothetical protein